MRFTIFHWKWDIDISLTSNPLIKDSFSEKNANGHDTIRMQNRINSRHAEIFQYLRTRTTDSILWHGSERCACGKRKRNFLGCYIYINYFLLSFLSLFLSLFPYLSVSLRFKVVFILVSKYWFITTTLKTSSISHNTVLLHAKPLFGYSTVMEERDTGSINA